MFGMWHRKLLDNESSELMMELSTNCYNHHIWGKVNENEQPLMVIGRNRCHNPRCHTIQCKCHTQHICIERHHAICIHCGLLCCIILSVHTMLTITVLKAQHCDRRMLIRDLWKKFHNYWLSTIIATRQTLFNQSHIPCTSLQCMTMRMSTEQYK